MNVSMYSGSSSIGIALSNYHSRILSLRSYNTCTHGYFTITRQILIVPQADARGCLFNRQNACAGTITSLPDPRTIILEHIPTGQWLFYLRGVF
jgi:hypothetical protein